MLQQSAATGGPAHCLTGWGCPSQEVKLPFQHSHDWQLLLGCQAGDSRGQNSKVQLACSSGGAIATCSQQQRELFTLDLLFCLCILIFLLHFMYLLFVIFNLFVFISRFCCCRCFFDAH